MDEVTRNQTQGETTPAHRTWLRRHAPLFVMLATLVWGTMVCTGLSRLWCYAHAAAVREAAPLRWPEASRIQRSGNRPALLLFAHPKCPCTRASIRELERLTTRVHGKMDTWVVFWKPAQGGQDWSSSELWQTAAAIPGVHVLCDEGGAETKRFRATISGLAVLYAPTGELLFEGGITASRGHQGDNDGSNSLAAIVLNRGSRTSQTPVFGCPLQSPDCLASQEPE